MVLAANVDCRRSSQPDVFNVLTASLSHDLLDLRLTVGGESLKMGAQSSAADVRHWYDLGRRRASYFRTTTNHAARFLTRLWLAAAIGTADIATREGALALLPWWPQAGTLGWLFPR